MSDPIDSAKAPPSDGAAGAKLLALLIAISSVGPLSVNIIVPAIPGLAVAFAADPAVVQLAVSLYFGGLGAAELGLGPPSHPFGGRPGVLGGLVLPVVPHFSAPSATNAAG